MLKWLLGKSKAAPQEAAPVADGTSGGFTKLKSALSLTGQSLMGQVMGLVQDAELTEDRVDEIEEALLRADVGVSTTVEMTEKLRSRKAQFKTPESLMDFLKQEFTTILQPYEQANQLKYVPGKLNIYLVVGVNGAGKTTFIGKLAYQFNQAGKKVIIGAGDTFRAAAEDQLAIWAERAGVALVRKDGADSAAVIFDALQQAKEQQADVLLLDTAGRLQNKFNLMEELRKIRKVIEKESPPTANLESLLVLDATTGQNALKQAEVFREAVDLSGVVLTKLDSSAKGGVILTIAKEYRLPVKMIGVGEQITDLQDFDPEAYVQALVSTSS